MAADSVNSMLDMAGGALAGACLIAVAGPAIALIATMLARRR
jgi:hypothetical protein